MPDSRSPYLAPVRSLVVKLGTQLLTRVGGRLDEPFLAAVATQVATLRRRGLTVTVVSSGAIGAGMGELNLPARPTDLAKLQAVAAVGQRRLMDAWAAAFAPHALHVAQLLLTREDVDDRARFLNLRNTIHAVHELGGVPVVNENDTVSTDEIVAVSFGDNDILAALVTHALAADLLVLLSVVDGIQSPAGESVRLVDSVDAARDWVRAERSALGKGGMDSKLTAARMGHRRRLGHGRRRRPAAGRAGEPAGRRRGRHAVRPRCQAPPARSRWIGSARPLGTIAVDAGAVTALIQKNPQPARRRRHRRGRPFRPRRHRGHHVPRRPHHRPRADQLRRRRGGPDQRDAHRRRAIIAVRRRLRRGDPP